MDNVPAGEVRRLGADKVLTVKFATDLKYEPKSIYDVVFKSVDILFEGRSQDAINESDFVLDLDMQGTKVFDTKKVDFCFEIGYITTITKIKEIKEMLSKDI